MSQGNSLGLEDRSNEKVRLMLYGHNIKDWVVVENAHDQTIAYGQIVDANVDESTISLECPTRYTLGESGFRKVPGVEASTFHSGTVARLISSDKANCLGRQDISPFVEALGSNVYLKGGTSEYVGLLDEVYRGHLVLGPYISSPSDVTGNEEYVISDKRLILPLSSLIVFPTSRSLEDILKELNEKLRKTNDSIKK